jgi:hypothetical protein
VAGNGRVERRQGLPNQGGFTHLSWASHHLHEAAWLGQSVCEKL